MLSSFWLLSSIMIGYIWKNSQDCGCRNWLWYSKWRHQLHSTHYVKGNICDPKQNKTDRARHHIWTPEAKNQAFVKTTLRRNVYASETDWSFSYFNSDKHHSWSTGGRGSLLLRISSDCLKWLFTNEENFRDPEPASPALARSQKSMSDYFPHLVNNREF